MGNGISMNQKLSLAIAFGFVISLGVLATSIVSITNANQRLEEILNINLEAASRPSPTLELSIDDQILQAQNKLRIASNGIRTRKVEIRRHAFDAIDEISSSGQAGISQATKILNDIAENSKKILQRNEEIEAETLHIYSLYQKKIETIIAAKDAQEESTFGLTFWAGIGGLFATLSTVVIAWRKDRLDHIAESRELVKLRLELTRANNVVAAS
jgi:hypothetical protein